jgi:hypothetical protein
MNGGEKTYHLPALSMQCLKMSLRCISGQEVSVELFFFKNVFILLFFLVKGGFKTIPS